MFPIEGASAKPIKDNMLLWHANMIIICEKIDKEVPIHFHIELTD
jgi:hypothetical protein